jgi:hypothetical protein
MNTESVPRTRMFKTAAVMSALWLGANTVLIWQAYGVGTERKPKAQTNFSFAEVHSNAHLDKLRVL